MTEAACLSESPMDVERCVPWMPGAAKQPTTPEELAEVLWWPVRIADHRNAHTVLGAGQPKHLVNGWMLYKESRMLIEDWCETDPSLPKPPKWVADPEGSVANALGQLWGWCRQAQRSRGEGRAASDQYDAIEARPAQPPAKKKGKPGRPKPAEDQLRRDRWVYEAWQDRGYRSFAEMAEVHGGSAEELHKAFDRHRKRLERGTA